jgi:hypothetical protein
VRDWSCEMSWTPAIKTYPGAILLGPWIIAIDSPNASTAATESASIAVSSGAILGVHTLSQ